MGKFPVLRDDMGGSCRQENVGEGVPIQRDAIGASYRQETVGQGDFSTPLRSARNDGAA